MADQEKPNWDNVDSAVTRLILDQAEKRLASQLTVSLAADARALNLLSLLFGLATAMAAYAVVNIVSTGSSPLLLGAAAWAAVLYVACALIAYSARPVDFYVPGNEPRNWFECTAEPINVLLGIEAENYDEMIAENERTINNNELALRRGITAALTSPLIALIILMISLSATAS